MSLDTFINTLNEAKITEKEISSFISLFYKEKNKFPTPLSLRVKYGNIPIKILREIIDKTEKRIKYHERLLLD